jgi:hypothetical protein
MSDYESEGRRFESCRARYEIPAKSEWRWRATGLSMAGVTLLGVRDGRIVWGRLYMEPVEEGGEDIDESVQSITERGERARTSLGNPQGGQG